MNTFLVAFLGFCAFMLVRNWRVYCFEMALLDAVSREAKADIEADREWRWRYDTLDSIKQDTMVLQFWKPLRLRSWWKDNAFVMPARVTR